MEAKRVQKQFGFITLYMELKYSTKLDYGQTEGQSNQAQRNTSIME